MHLPTPLCVLLAWLLLAALLGALYSLCMRGTQRADRHGDDRDAH